MDSCLKRYLGRIVKCRSVEELEQVRDGVTPDCYSYSNFIFRHLKKKDYTLGACIGGKVSRARLAEYEEDVAKLSKELEESERVSCGLKTAREMESLKDDPEYLERLSSSARELEEVLTEKDALEQEIARLREGRFKELEEREKELRSRRDSLKNEAMLMQNEMTRQVGTKERIRGEIDVKRQSLEEMKLGYTPDKSIEAEIKESLKKRSAQSLKMQKNAGIDALLKREEEQAEALGRARSAYIVQFPSSGFSGTEKSNEAYERLLEQYRTDFEPKYRIEFEKQCDLIYRSLREKCDRYDTRRYQGSKTPCL